MINEIQAKKFCKDYTKIENYEEAVDDQSQVWHCHHILGEILSREQLKDHDFYYDVPPCMLKFVTRAEHLRLHSMNMSEETRRKISESLKGENNPMHGRTGENHPLFGKKRSEDTRRKISESVKRRWAKRKDREFIEERNT